MSRPSPSHPWRRYAKKLKQESWIEDNAVRLRTDGTNTSEQRVRSSRRLLTSRYSEHEEDSFKALRDPYADDSGEEDD